MPLIDRFLPPPRAFPPPCGAAATRDCVDFAAQRDPYGDAVHTTLGCLYLATAGLSTATESIAFVLLVGYALLRTPNVLRAWGPLLGSPLVWLLLAWCGWALMGGWWAPDREAWADALGGFRGLLILPALYPIRRQWRALLGAFIVGMAAQAFLQVLQAAGWIGIRDPDNLARPSGLHGHPAQVSIYEAAAIMVAAAWMVEARSLAARALLALSIPLLLAGITIAAGRAALLGILVAGPALLAMLAIAAKMRSRTIAIAAGAAVAAAALVLGAVWLAGGSGLQRQAGDIAALDRPTTSTGQRMLWWQASIRAFAAHPLVGAGPGATPTLLRADPGVRAAIESHPDYPEEAFVVAHPHSAYLQTLAEQGLIGGFLFAGVVVAAAISSWRSIHERPIYCGIAAAAIVWLVAAGFDAVHMAGRTAALGCILLAFIALPRRHPSEPASAAGMN